VLDQHGLDVGSVDVVATPDDDVLLAADDVDVALPVESTPRRGPRSIISC
jgi:hypothetical protein